VNQVAGCPAQVLRVAELSAGVGAGGSLELPGRLTQFVAGVQCGGLGEGVEDFAGGSDLCGSRAIVVVVVEDEQGCPAAWVVVRRAAAGAEDELRRSGRSLPLASGEAESTSKRSWMRGRDRSGASVEPA
jgi:hypothetical protein